MDEKNNYKYANIELIIIICLLIIILGAAVYYFFFKKENNGSEITPTPTATSKTNIESPNRLPINTEFKSKDGKDTLTITKIDHYTFESGSSDEYLAFGVFNKQKYVFLNVYEDDPSDNDYFTLEGHIEDDESWGACLPLGILLDLKTKTIEKASTKGKSYNAIKGLDSYFFTERNNCFIGYELTLYDSSWKKLGQTVGLETDSEGNIYAFDDGKIIKYNQNGNKISETSTTAKYVGPAVIYNNTLYYMGEESSGGYLYNNDTNEKYKLYDQSIDFKEDRYPYSGLDVEALTNIILENNKILIRYESDEVGYTFDPNTKQLTKIN